MKQRLVFATNNAHKLQEVRQILGDAFEVVSLEEIGCRDDIPETEPTLEGNALLKARWVASRYGCSCFADDTGLEVEVLGGAPGVRSARYAASEGEPGHDSEANMLLLLKNLLGVADRRARFRTVMALVRDNGEEVTVSGRVEGKIIEAPRGTDGFGYDPVFVPEGDTRTFAEMTAEEKNAVSHRRRATEALLRVL